MKFLKLSDEELTDKQRQLQYITQNLEATYGILQVDGYDDPLDELIAAVLSQSTTNINSHRAFASLKKRFPDWELALRGSASTIAKAIKSGGLANVKSVVIKGILTEIKHRRGNLDLQFLKALPMREARKFLMTLKGVGPKTAACVLLFSCRQVVFPIDTHIFRITRHLGLISYHLMTNRHTN